jgi:biopolymer transport protein ExbB/TolQ
VESDLFQGSQKLEEPERVALRRRWTIWLWAGILLSLGPVFGLLGTLLGMLHSFRVIESLKAPRPGDLAVGVYESLFATTAGLIALPIGVGLVVLSCQRLQHLRAEPPAGPGAPAR